MYFNLSSLRRTAFTEVLLAATGFGCKSSKWLAQTILRRLPIARRQLPITRRCLPAFRRGLPVLRRRLTALRRCLPGIGWHCKIIGWALPEVGPSLRKAGSCVPAVRRRLRIMRRSLPVIGSCRYLTAYHLIITLEAVFFDASRRRLLSKHLQYKSATQRKPNVWFVAGLHQRRTRYDNSFSIYISSRN